MLQLNTAAHQCGGGANGVQRHRLVGRKRLAAQPPPQPHVCLRHCGSNSDVKVQQNQMYRSPMHGAARKC